jgi:prepilin-type N-terminal cleavage/methylation domain-containing protein
MRQGDTLIEVVFALAILATLLTVLTTSAIASWRTSRIAGERTRATGIVQEQVEALKAYRAGVGWGSFSTNPQLTGPNPFLMVPTGANPLATPNSWQAAVVPVASTYGIYTVNIQKQPTPAGETTNTYIYKVKAVWKSLGNSGLNSTDQLVRIGS